MMPEGDERVKDIYLEALALHERHQGKLEIRS
jgi:hypothetical protein